MELVAFVAVLASPFVVMAFGLLLWLSVSSRKGADVVWADYARARRLTFVPAAGDWPNRTPASMAWSEGRTSYSIHGARDEAAAMTWAIARPRDAVRGTFELRPTPSGARDRGTGDPLIDSRFVVAGEPRSLVDAILTPDVKRALVAFDIGRRGSLTYEAGEVVLSWSSLEVSTSRLDEARALARRLAQAVEMDGAQAGTALAKDVSP